MANLTVILKSVSAVLREPSFEEGPFTPGASAGRRRAKQAVTFWRAHVTRLTKPGKNGVSARPPLSHTARAHQLLSYKITILQPPPKFSSGKSSVAYYKVASPHSNNQHHHTFLHAFSRLNSCIDAIPRLQVFIFWASSRSNSCSSRRHQLPSGAF
jgi:hypothetical protein